MTPLAVAIGAAHAAATVFTIAPVHAALRVTVPVPIVIHTTVPAMAYGLTLTYPAGSVRIEGVTAGPAVNGCMVGDDAVKGTGSLRIEVACIKALVRNGVLATVELQVTDPTGAMMKAGTCLVETHNEHGPHALPCRFEGAPR